MPSSPPIYFHFLTPFNGLRERSRLKQFLFRELLAARRQLTRLDFIFCDDNYLLKINQEHLRHNFYTDIITFNLANDSNTIEGEVYISIPRVRDNAIKFDTSVKQELHRVIFHGLLHLLGFGDKTSVEKKKMRKAEDDRLGQYFD
jgi:rRNA maturation RNase YbeY